MSIDTPVQIISPRKYIRFSIPILLCSVFIAIAQLVGWSFARIHGTDVNLPLFPPLVVSVIVIVGLSALLYLVLSLLFRWFDVNLNFCRVSSRGFFFRHPFAVSLLLISLSWLPYLLVFFPGSLPWDGVRSMNQFITDAPLENHHPVVMNVLYASLMTVGRSLYSDNLGLLLIVIFQFVVCVVSFALVIKQMVDLLTPRWLVIAALLFYCLCPIWGVFAQAAFKDTLFNGIFCLFVLAVTKVIIPRDSVSWRPWAMLLAMALVVCFVRNNGVYLVLPTVFGIGFYFAVSKQAQRIQPRLLERIKPTVAILVVVGVLWLVVMNLVWPALGIATKEEKEMLSVPFQQTARYLAEHPEDITSSERAAIEAVFPYDALPDLYNPDLSDPVKESAGDEQGNMTAEQRANYFGAWLSMGVRHTDTYIYATLANTYAYFYPGIIIGQDIDRPVLPLYIQGDPINKDFDVHYMGSSEVRERLNKALVASLDIPFVSALYSPALYVLALLVVNVYAIARRNATVLIVSIPCFMLLLTTLAGPLNGHLRYVLPIAATLPLLYTLSLRQRGKDDCALGYSEKVGVNSCSGQDAQDRRNNSSGAASLSQYHKRKDVSKTNMNGDG